MNKKSFNTFDLLDHLEEELEKEKNPENITYGMQWIKFFRQRLNADLHLMTNVVHQDNDSNEELAERFAMQNALLMLDIGSIFGLKYVASELTGCKQFYLEIIPEIRANAEEGMKKHRFKLAQEKKKKLV